MRTPALVPPSAPHPTVTAGIVSRFGQIALSFGVLASILFVGAGRLDWMWAWAYLGISLLSVVITGSLMLQRSPETLAERGHPGAMQDWDKLISGLWTAAQYLALPLIAALDARFSWTSVFGLAWHGAGVIMLITGLVVSSWAMLANAYFSTVVRIQPERGQTVCRSGPYRFVRHPGYTGFMLQSLGLPFLLGSWWALLPGLIACMLMGMRTVFEDRLLQAELAGYQAYAQDVRFRLIPGVW